MKKLFFALALLALVSSAQSHTHGRGVATPAAQGLNISTDVGTLITTDAGLQIRVDP